MADNIANFSIEQLNGEVISSTSLSWKYIDMKEKLSGKHQTSMFKAIIESLGEGIIVIDRDLKIVYQNNIMNSFFDNILGEYCYHAYYGNDEP